MQNVSALERANFLCLVLSSCCCPLGCVRDTHASAGYMQANSQVASCGENNREKTNKERKSTETFGRLDTLEEKIVFTPDRSVCPGRPHPAFNLCPCVRQRRRHLPPLLQLSHPNLSPLTPSEPTSTCSFTLLSTQSVN